MPAAREFPSTLRRSSKKAQRTWSEAHDSAMESYGEGERAHRTAFSALKHSFEKVGDHWVAKTSKGPSDPRRGGRTYGGVDVEGHTKDELYERARKLNVPGRSKMTKHELAAAIARTQRARR